MTDYQPNSGQKLAAEAFFDFLLTDTKGFILSGPAGVGKTYWMGYIIDEIMPQYLKTCELMGMKPEYTDVTMTATTNKAAEVLGLSTQRDTSTIHSFMNIRVREDYDLGKQFLTRTPQWVVHQNRIIFIDEFSMIDSDLDDIINSGTENCKIVYVGDQYQLPPVFETLTPVLRKGYPVFELTEQMRNSGQPALMAICEQLRETVRTGVFKPIQTVPGVIEHLDDNQMQIELINALVANPEPNSRILAYSNKQVNLFNEYVREQRQLPNLFTTGETLVNNSMLKLNAKQILSVEASVKVIDARGTRVEKIGRDGEFEVQELLIRTPYHGDHMVLVPTDKGHYDQLIKYFKRIKDWVNFYKLQQQYADLRPRDASTVHKSQGSTYDTVFIDLENISKCTQPDVAARMLYVAFSRAKHKVYLYGRLADRFGGTT